MIGVSVDTVKSWTRKKPLEVSSIFRLAITLSTGAVIQPDGSVDSFPLVPFIKFGLLKRSGAFSREEFDSWRNELCPSTEKFANRASEFAALLIKALFTEAVKPVRGKRFKLPGVVDSFNRWFIDTATDFNISAFVKKSRVLEPGSMTPDQARMFLFSTGIGTPLDKRDTMEWVVTFEEEIAKLRQEALKESPAPKRILDRLDEMAAKVQKAKKSFPNPTVSVPNQIPVRA